MIIKNKERLVGQGFTQLEGLDYDEAFALVAPLEVIRLFLAFDSFKNFKALSYRCKDCRSAWRSLSRIVS